MRALGEEAARSDEGSWNAGRGREKTGLLAIGRGVFLVEVGIDLGPDQSGERVLLCYQSFLL